MTKATIVTTSRDRIALALNGFQPWEEDPAVWILPSRYYGHKASVLMSKTEEGWVLSRHFFITVRDEEGACVSKRAYKAHAPSNELIARLTQAGYDLARSENEWMEHKAEMDRHALEAGER